MSSTTDEDLFAAIDANVRMGTTALHQTLMQAKSAVARDRDATERNALAKVSYLLLAAQYEARLGWLIWHPNSKLERVQRIRVLHGGGFAKRWKLLLQEALATRLNAAENSTSVVASDVPACLSAEHRAIYYDLRSISRHHLDPMIDVRNSLAHGEWTVALTPRADGFNEGRSTAIEAISLYRVTILANLLDHFWKSYFDALVTQFAFERDFRVHHRRMMHASVRLSHGDEAQWLRTMRKRKVDGSHSKGGLSQPPEHPDGFSLVSSD